MALYFVLLSSLILSPLALGAGMSRKSLLLDYWLTLEGAPKNPFMEGATYYSLYIAYLEVPR